MTRRSARPYAAALFAVLKPQGLDALREAEAGLRRMVELLQSWPELTRFFEVPTVPPKRKRQALGLVAQALQLPHAVSKLLELLVGHFRLRGLPEVAALFGALVDRLEGVVRGVVEVPAPLTPEQLKALQGVLSSLMGGRVELESRVEEELLAGFVVRLGSLVFDGSTRRQLERFAEGAGYAR